MKTPMNVVNDDRFRNPGSRYEWEQVVAFTEVEHGDETDQEDSPAPLPTPTLCIPEVLFHELAARTRLGRIDLQQPWQARLSREDCRELLQQLSGLENTAHDDDVRLAARLVREKAQAVADSTLSLELLIKGEY